MTLPLCLSGAAGADAVEEQQSSGFSFISSENAPEIGRLLSVSALFFGSSALPVMLRPSRLSALLSSILNCI